MRIIPSVSWLVAVLPLLVACSSESGANDDVNGPAGGGDNNGGANGGNGPGQPGDPGASPSETPGGGSISGKCIAQPACNGTSGPAVGEARPWIHNYVSPAVVASGPAFHRGRDQIFAVGDPQWIIGKFTYSYVDTDLDDEDVDIYVEHECVGNKWEKLGTARTTNGETVHPTTEGVADEGGRVYFQIPKGKELPVGRHRIRLVVAGDLSSTDLLIDVVPKNTQIVVSDVDGTLTDSENAEYGAIRDGKLPNAQPRAAEALTTLANKGFHIVYLSARPEWLTGRTREFLSKSGFPTGVVHTTSGITGAVGAFATTFKSDELALLKSHSHKIGWAFGNQASDTDAYATAEINPLDHRVFLRVDDAHGGRRIEAYSEVIGDVTAQPAVCK